LIDLSQRRTDRVHFSTEPKLCYIVELVEADSALR
jgi:hypothetical protein